MNKLNISTNDLINKLPVGFQLSNSELKLIEVLESDLNIPLKQIEIFKIQQKRFLIDIETDLTTDDILKSKATSIKKEDINKIIQALTVLMESDKNIGQPYYYLLKNWFDDQLKREYLASLVFSMIQVGLKQQRRAYNDDVNEATVSEANFIYQVGKAFLNTFLQLELAFKREEIARSSKDLSESNGENFDEIEDKVVFKYNKFSIQAAIKHIGRRNMRLASQKKDLRLTPDELSSIDEEIKHLKQMREELKGGNFFAVNKTVPELTQLTVSKLKLAYGFIRLKDQLDLGNTIVNLLRELGYITITNRDGKTSTIGLAPYLLKRYVWWLEDTLLPVIDPTGLKIVEDNSSFTVVWRNIHTYYEDPLIHQRESWLQEIGIKEERIITLQTQMQQAFIIDKEFLYEILRDSDNLKQELVKFIRGKSLQEKKEVEYCINYSSYESYEKARPSYIKESVWNKYYTLYNLLAAEFYQILRIAIIFREYKLYFPVYLDSRARLYTQGWPLNPIGRKNLTRKLLRFESSKMCEFDAHAQGLQIWGILANEITVLKYTKLLPIEDEDTASMIKRERTNRLDLYSYIGFEYNNLLKEEIKSWKFADETNVEKVDQMIDLITRRELVKYLVMCLIYSEQTKARAKRILSDDSVNKQFNLLSNNTDCAFEKGDKSYTLYAMIIFFAELLEKLMEEKLPKIKKFQEMFIKLIKAIQAIRFVAVISQEQLSDINDIGTEDYKSKKKRFNSFKKAAKNSINSRVMLSWHDTFKAENIYQLDESVPVALAGPNGIRQITFKRNVIDEEGKPVFDPRKFRSALFPNFLHCGDGYLVHFVLKEFHKANQCVWPVHDAFYTTEKNRKFVNQAYLKAIKVLFKEDPIRQLVRSNKVHWSDIPSELQDFFDKMHQERCLLISQFINNEILG